MSKNTSGKNPHDWRYQQLFYTDYQIMHGNGECEKSNRKDCFAFGTKPTTDNPFYQRWSYDPESGLAIRLPRNELGEMLGKMNEADLRDDERFGIRKIQCVGKTDGRCRRSCSNCPFADYCNSKHRATDGKKCNKKCEGCPHFMSRNIDLDRNWENPDINNNFDLADEAADVAAIVEDETKLATLIVKLDSLSDDDRELFSFLINRERKQVIADHFKISLDGVRWREGRLKKILHADEALKNFFTN